MGRNGPPGLPGPAEGHNVDHWQRGRDRRCMRWADRVHHLPEKPQSPLRSRCCRLKSGANENESNRQRVGASSRLSPKNQTPTPGLGHGQREPGCVIRFSPGAGTPSIERLLLQLSWRGLSPTPFRFQAPSGRTATRAKRGTGVQGRRPSFSRCTRRHRSSQRAGNDEAQ